ncbi:hypothetical protein F4703DRAFT_1791296 [Phycomyces blakesleeanus]
MPTEAKKYDYVVAIDLGTTYSGHAWVDIQEYEHHNQNYELNRQFTRTKKRKEVTSAAYKEKTKRCINCDIFLERKEKDVSKHTQPHLHCDHVGKFKLWLDRTMKDPTPLPNGLTPIEVISDYLRYLHMAAVDEIVEKGLKDLSRIRYCLTVPIIWSEESRSIMRDAAIISGIIKKDDDPDRLIIVDEPVAAAMYCEAIFPEFCLDDGNRYMICDAGGGTVDLATFEIDKSTGKNGLREITMGSGSLCGSSFLDVLFAKLLKERLSNLTENQVTTFILTNDFSYKKLTFDNKRDLDVLGYYNEEGPEYGIKEITVSFSRYQICEEVFEPVVCQVIELIENQLGQLGSRRLDVMFITGGFGQSPYLNNHGQLAVIRGALLYGVNPQEITQRILRRTYGIKFDTPSGSQDNLSMKMYGSKRKFYGARIVYRLYDLPVPQNPSPEDLDIVAMFDTKFQIDSKQLKKQTIMVLNLRFGLDKIHVKVNIAGREFDYITVHDLTGEKEKLSYTEINPPPSGKIRKLFLMDEIKNLFLLNILN